MKFKSKKDLMNEKYGIQINTNNWEQEKVIESDGFIKGLDYAFKSFKERLDFYESYKDNAMVQLSRDHPEAIQNLVKSKPEHFGVDNIILTDKRWNEWLFQYCFGDIE